MMGQYKGRDIFKFRPTCAQWFASNHLPRTRDTSSGFTRRWLFLTFNKPCPPDQKRVNFAKEILADEREAIAAWCIPAILDVMRRQDLTLPASHLMQVGEIANLNNSVRQFLKSGQVLYRGDLSVTEHDVYNAYLMYCRLVSHAQPMALSRFRTVIGALSTELRFDQRMVADANGAETTRFVGIDIVRAKPRT
jgi:phage/plasmid-associated DNA primase